MPMRQNEFARVVIIAEVALKRGPAHSDCDIFANLEMQMGVVNSVRGSHRRNLLSSGNSLALLHKNPIEMTVKRIDVFYCARFAKRMPHNHNIAPAKMHIASKNNDAIANAENRIAQISIATPESVPILAEMAFWTEPARFIVTLPIRFPDWKIEPIC